MYPIIWHQILTLEQFKIFKLISEIEFVVRTSSFIREQKVEKLKIHALKGI